MTSPARIDQAQDTPQRRIEALLGMSRRLCNVLASDIAALERGDFGGLATTDPEIGRLCALYGREVTALKTMGGIKNVPAQIVAELKESGGRLSNLLAHHESLVSCMREASEGLIKAVAEEVEKTRKSGAPYSAGPKPQRKTSGGAIIYNKVI